MECNDNQLVMQCLAGGRGECDRLYEIHAPRVKVYMLRCGFADADADDLTQETFMRIYRSLGSFDSTRGSFTQWLGAIAKNTARKQWAKRKSPDNFDPMLADEMFEDRYCEANAPETRELIELIDRAVKLLPEELRKLIELRFKDGLTTRKIGEVMDLPESTVRLRLAQATDQLGICMKKVGIS